MLSKNTTITDWKNIFKRGILIGSRLSIYSSLVLNKPDGKEKWTKNNTKLFFIIKFFLDTQAIKLKKIFKSYRAGLQCPVKYLENIGPAMQQSNWLILFTGPVNQLSRMITFCNRYGIFNYANVY